MKKSLDSPMDGINLKVTIGNIVDGLIQQHGFVGALIAAEEDLQDHYEADADLQTVQLKEDIVNLCIDRLELFLDSQDCQNKELRNRLEEKKR